MALRSELPLKFVVKPAPIFGSGSSYRPRPVNPPMGSLRGSDVYAVLLERWTAKIGVVDAEALDGTLVIELDHDLDSQSKRWIRVEPEAGMLELKIHEYNIRAYGL